jgi:hypothetical protein
VTRSPSVSAANKDNEPHNKPNNDDHPNNNSYNNYDNGTYDNGNADGAYTGE